MATTTTTTTTTLFYSLCSIIKPSSTSSTPDLLPFPSTRTRRLPRLNVTGTDFLGDFGARDPFPAELESNFGEKVLGNMSTEHKILIPQALALALSQQSCIPISPDDTPLSKDDAKQLLFKIIGWRILEDEQEDGKTALKLTCLWKLKDFDAGVELKDRISKVAYSTGHSPVFQQEDNKLTAVLWTQKIGGLSINDFIVAAKIDEVKISDLLPKKRFWA